MTHEPEQLAAAYLANQMRPRGRRRYESHLLACDTCWQEVTLARRGRELAETTHETAPPTLREDIRAAITEAATTRVRQVRGKRHILTVCAAIVIATVSGIAVTRPWQHASAPGSGGDALHAVVASYREERLPGTTIPAEPAPNLTRLGLTLVSAGAGQINGIAVTLFCYRSANGTRINLYRSAHAFTETAAAHELGRHDNDSAWTVDSNGVTVICSRGAHSTLLLGSDASLLHRAAVLLNAI